MGKQTGSIDLIFLSMHSSQMTTYSLVSTALALFLSVFRQPKKDIIVARNNALLKHEKNNLNVTQK